MTVRSIVKNKKLFIGLIMLTIFLALGIFSPLLIPFPYDRTYVGPSLKGPSAEHWFGRVPVMNWMIW